MAGYPQQQRETKFFQTFFHHFLRDIPTPRMRLGTLLEKNINKKEIFMNYSFSNEKHQVTHFFLVQPAPPN